MNLTPNPFPGLFILEEKCFSTLTLCKQKRQYQLSYIYFPFKTGTQNQSTQYVSEFWIRLKRLKMWILFVSSQNLLWNFFRRQSFILEKAEKVTYITRSFAVRRPARRPSTIFVAAGARSLKSCRQHLCKQLRWHWGGLTVLSSRWPWNSTFYSFLLNSDLICFAPGWLWLG